MNLVELKPQGKVVFVGDTHGDVDASQKVINKYLNKNTKICFLGDYVDRGTFSQWNIEYLLNEKKGCPENIFLLRGNHETYCTLNFSPSDFWMSLTIPEQKKYDEIFKEFPLAISVGGIIALHGALPYIENIREIEKIEDKDKKWFDVLWGDYTENIHFDKLYENGERVNSISIRPLKGRTSFESIMSKLNKKVLVRSHQPDAKERMFENKCLTIFTSLGYRKKRTIAVADFDKYKEINSIDDLIIEEI